MKSIQLSALSSVIVDELLVYSLDPCLYSVRVVIEGNYYTVKKGRKLYKAFAIGHIYRDFSQVNIQCITVLQDSAYDEMVGQPMKPSGNRLRITAPVKNIHFDDNNTVH